MTTHADTLWLARMGALRPDPRLSVAEWADTHRVLTSAETSEPGQWHTSRVEFLREIMDRLSLHDPTPRVVLMCASQLGKTECGLNLVGYVVDNAPCPVMVLRPTIDDCQGYSKQRLKHLFEAPRLRGKVSEVRSRDAGNTIMLKEFVGGLLVLAGANAPGRLASWPIRVLHADEIDRYPESAGTEGDPLSLARKRLTRFGARAKELDTSTPTIKDQSRIESEYNASSMARWEMACPHCGEYQTLEWADDDGPLLRWDGDPVEGGDQFRVWYECAFCSEEIREVHKGAMLAGGRWSHKHPDRPVRGYAINALAAPVGSVSWRVLVEEWVYAMARSKLGDNEPLKVFINTRLAQTWEDRGETVDPSSIEARKEPWADDTSIAPYGVRTITAGVDVQDDRLEVEVVGWGSGFESWSLGYYVIGSDPLDAQTWAALDAIRNRDYTTEEGHPMRIAAMCVDSGYRTQSVYEYARLRGNVHAIKGMTGKGRHIWERKIRKGGRQKSTGRFHLVGTDTAKDTVARYLNVVVAGPGYCHFPEARQSNYFEMLTAEKRMPVKDRRGKVTYEWRLKAAGRRNEALDTRVYALAAVHSILASGATIDSEPLPPTKSSVKSEESHAPQPKTASGRRRGKSRRGGAARGSTDGWFD